MVRGVSVCLLCSCIVSKMRIGPDVPNFLENTMEDSSTTWVLFVFVVVVIIGKKDARLGRVFFSFFFLGAKKPRSSGPFVLVTYLCPLAGYKNKQRSGKLCVCQREMSRRNNNNNGQAGIDVEAQLSFVEELLREERARQTRATGQVINENDVLRIEKRVIRYRIASELAGKNKLPNRNFTDVIRRYKQNLFRCKRNHNCTPQHCKFSHEPAGRCIYDPRVADRSVWCTSTGLVHVCLASGIAHLCGERCRSYMVQRQGILVCEISGLMIGTQISHVEGRRPRPDVEAAVEWASRKEGATEDAAAALDEDGLEELDAPSRTKKSPKIPSSKRRKRTRDDSSSDDEEIREKISRSQVELQRAMVEDSIFGINPAAASRPGCQTTAALLRDIKLAKFAPGSAAERMQARSGGGRLATEACYGRELILYSFEGLTQSNRETAEVICDVIMHDPVMKKAFEKKQVEMHQAALRAVDKYVQYCVEHQQVPERFFVYRLLWCTHRQILPDILARCISADSDRHLAKGYFAEAVIKFWKILECTPYCCDSNLETGGAASKKKRTRTHLKRIAPAIMYLLRDGMTHWVAYDIPSRIVLPDLCSLDNAQNVNKQLPPTVAREEVSFLPAHRYLAVRMPQVNDFKLLDFSSVPPDGQVGTDIIYNRRWVQSCIRSLLTVLPPLTIDAVRQYCLSAHMIMCDESPETGRFQRTM